VKTNRSFLSRAGNFCRLTIAGVWICTALAGCGSKDQSAATQNNWKQFSSDAGNFSIQFPGTPKEKTALEETVFGEIEVHSFIVETDIQTAYGINYNDFPPRLNLSNPEPLFDGGQASAIGKTGIVITQRSMRFKGYPAREFEFKAGGKANYSGRVRLILVGRRLYNLVTIFLTENPHVSDREKFFDSFSLNKG